jgi:hypothetical protein
MTNALQTKRPPVSRKLVRQPLGPVDKRRRKRGLTVAIRTAIDAMLYDRCARPEACERAGISERALYLAFEKAEVAVYFNRCLQVLRAGERPRNIHRLAEIRDAANNMPAVQAIKTLEMLDAEAVARPLANESPHITIVIRQPDRAPAMTTVQHSPPVIERAPKRDPREPFFRDPTG